MSSTTAACWRRHVRLDQVELPESADAASILRRVPATAGLCALDREGRRDEQGVGGTDRGATDGACRLAFVVGGPFGLDHEVLERADQRLSFGPRRFPTGLPA